nr:hypothetical protein BaRGS_021712 [Batillaria attramentaria]
MKHADDDVLEQILPHCTDDQVESALHVAVSRRLWFAVSELLQRPVSDTKRAWAVEEARTNADDSHLEAILLHCTDDQLGLVFDTAVCRQLWSVIGQLSLRPVDNIRLAWAVKEAVQHADDFHLAVILPHCPDDQLDSVLMQRKWVVVQASILAHEEILKQLITVYPIDISDVPDPVLQNLISRVDLA